MRFLKYILLLLVGQTIAQTTITTQNALSKYTDSKGVVVIEFWAEWNKKNSCSFLKDLEDCNIVRADIGICTALQEKYNIEVLPTLVVINNGVEISRFTGNLLFQLNVKKKEVQAKIDSIIISKFE
jgi:thioredoxin-like negative regulator of GroEL